MENLRPKKKWNVLTRIFTHYKEKFITNNSVSLKFSRFFNIYVFVSCKNLCHIFVLFFNNLIIQGNFFATSLYVVNLLFLQKAQVSSKNYKAWALLKMSNDYIRWAFCWNFVFDRTFCICGSHADQKQMVRFLVWD